MGSLRHCPNTTPPRHRSNLMLRCPGVEVALEAVSSSAVEFLLSL